ncbi:MAG: hypothetical protein JST80_02545 [Bdellovibrionales bacterium]|nr:hypothetical protein [Bdellovibrionales bacterium]
MKIHLLAVLACMAVSQAFAEEETVIATCNHYKIVYSGQSEGTIAGIKMSTSDIWIQYPNALRGKMSLSLSETGATARNYQSGVSFIYYTDNQSKTLEVYGDGADKTISCQ